MSGNLTWLEKSRSPQISFPYIIESSPVPFQSWSSLELPKSNHVWQISRPSTSFYKLFSELIHVWATWEPSHLLGASQCHLISKLQRLLLPWRALAHHVPPIPCVLPMCLAVPPMRNRCAHGKASQRSSVPVEMARNGEVPWPCLWRYQVIKCQKTLTWYCRRVFNLAAGHSTLCMLLLWDILSWYLILCHVVYRGVNW